MIDFASIPAAMALLAALSVPWLDRGLPKLWDCTISLPSGAQRQLMPFAAKSQQDAEAIAAACCPGARVVACRRLA